MPAPSRELLRNYDNAIVAWLETIRVNYGTVFGRDLSDHPICRVISSAERGFADVRDQLKAQGFLDTNEWSGENNKPAEAATYRVAPLPYVRIQRESVPEPVNEDHMTPIPIRFMHSVGLTWKQYRAPVPYDITYTIEFVTKTQYTMDYCVEWFLDQFNKRGTSPNQRYMQVNHPVPWGTLLARTTYESGSNNSDLEVSGASDRALRQAFSVRVRAYDLDLVGENKGTSLDIVVDVHDKSGSDPDLSIYGDKLLAGKVIPQVVLDLSPVAIQQLQSNVDPVVLSWDVVASQFVLSDPAHYLRTVSVPFRADHLVQGLVAVKCRREDDMEPAAPIYMDTLWQQRDGSGNYTTRVVDTQVVNINPQTRVGVAKFRTIPGTDSNEVAVQFRKGADNKNRLAIVNWQMSRLTIINLVPQGSRTIGPNAGTQSDVLVSNLTPGLAYVCRAFVDKAVENVTVSLFADAGASQLISTKTYASDGEFTVYFTPKAAGTALLRVTVPSADAAMTVTGITICRAGTEN